MKRSMSPSSTPVLTLFLIFVASVSTCIDFGLCYGRINGGGCRQSEREVLLKIKKDLIDPSGRLASWSVSSGDCCSWYGVICDNSTGHVLELHLHTPFYGEPVSSSGEFDEEYMMSTPFLGESHLISADRYGKYSVYSAISTGAIAMSDLFGGKISPFLLNLTHLRYLDLSHNELERIQIPKFFCSMVTLTYLNLFAAGFEGEIPPQLGNLTNLRYLNLRSYLSSSQSMVWLSTLSSLQFLDFSEADLSKASNWMEVITTLPSLQRLHLSSCLLPPVPPVLNVNVSSLSVLDLSNSLYHFSHLSWVSRFKHLKSLSLASNYIEGSLLREIQNLTSLRELDLSGNSFNASVPNWLFDLRHLEILNLADNDFSNCQLLHVPPSVHNVTFSSLSTLDLSYNQFDDSVFPNCIFGLKSLSSLYLPYNNLQGLLTIDFKNMTSLTELYLYKNDFSSSIPMWLHRFTNLQLLDLADSNLHCKLSNSIGNMTSLVSLDLSGNYELVGGIPASFKQLCNLRSLSLSNTKLSQEVNKVFESLLGCGSKVLELLNLRNCSLLGDWVTKDLGQFKSLASLDLGNNSISGAIPMSLVELNSLTFLDLSFNKMDGNLPINIGKLRKLKEFYMAHNFISGPIPTSLVESSFLMNLHLSGNKLDGILPVVLGKLKNLQIIDISHNSISGPIPVSFGKLKNLQIMDIAYNSISGPIPESFGKLKNLQIMDISYNSISGPIPLSFEKLKNLQIMDISYNSISGPLPMSFGEMSSSRSLYLSNNKLNGTLPVSFGMLSNLELADISHNSMEGDVSEIHFKNLSKLESFLASGNKLKLRVGPSWMPPISLVELELGSWDVGPQFPTWIPLLENLLSLDLSNSGISSSIPVWFSESYQFQSLDLSNNRITGLLPTFSSELHTIDLSNNLLFGTVSNFLCHKTRDQVMQILNLEKNLLFGELPDCWKRWPVLTSVKLSSNKFNGSISKSIGTLSILQYLHLRNNRLSGELPLSLKHCEKLVTLDLGENELVGSIPRWIGKSFSSLVVLNFRTNKFDGVIPEEICQASSLQILDFANNNLFGSIPGCFSNFSEMVGVNDLKKILPIFNNSSNRGNFSTIASMLLHMKRGNFSKTAIDSMLLQMKGGMSEYSTILGLVRIVDLSNNRLSGEIPQEMTRLAGLMSLNLSHNLLGGRIPKDIGGMSSIEIIDLSNNRLIGEIPPSISNLTFLSRLNFSNNKLVGRIPSSAQIQGFDSSSFIGNELCGKPLTKNCSPEGTVIIPSSKENGKESGRHGFEMEWFYVTLAFGFIVGFWGVVGPLLFSRNWRKTYFQFIQKVENKIYIWWHFK